MSESKRNYTTKGQHGGRRIAGKGKKIGKPANIGTNGKRYQDYLDDETIETLKMINPNRSEAIRLLAKKFKG